MSWLPWIGRSATAAIVILSAVAAMSDEPQPPLGALPAPLWAAPRENSAPKTRTAGALTPTEPSFGVRIQIRRQPAHASGPLMLPEAAFQGVGNQWIILEPLFSPPARAVARGRFPPSEEITAEAGELRQYALEMVFVPMGPFAVKAGLALNLADAGTHRDGEASSVESPRIGASIGFGYHIKDTFSLDMDYIYILADGFPDGPGTLSGQAVGAGENAPTTADQFLGAVLRIQF